ncbi:HXXEE domain-containing protein [Terriglobus sp.]|uniref:HXXEE domain-containing protein n=1 Tax=Terriglobus sp. TaxID=1889013 RepID=UPI003B0037C5
MQSPAQELSQQTPNDWQNPVAEALAWLDNNWHAAGAVAAVFYLLLFGLQSRWNGWQFWLAIQLPIYVVHQLEEHVHDRFRLAINRDIGRGSDVLSHRAVLLINVIGVWVIEWTALYLAIYVHPGWAMLAFALAVINALSHIGGAIALRSYNPGLVTALLLLLPSGIAGARALRAATPLTSAPSLASIAIIVVEHIWIVAHVLHRRVQLQQHSSPAGRAASA